MKRIRELLDSLGYKCISSYVSPQYVLSYEKNNYTDITVTKWKSDTQYKLEVATFYSKDAMKKKTYKRKHYKDIIELIKTA